MGQGKLGDQLVVVVALEVELCVCLDETVADYRMYLRGFLVVILKPDLSHSPPRMVQYRNRDSRR